ncbi:hypothetical protein Tco_1445773, partial [Tanacetum coccineum]
DMAAPTIHVSAEENLGDPIDIRVDIIHPKPVATVAFPAATEEMSTLRFRIGMVEAENASLRGKIKTIEAIEMITHSQEKRVRMEMERQLASVQEKERIKPLRVRALVMTIGLDLPKQILNAQTGAQKPENLKYKDVGGMIRKDIPKEKYVGPLHVLAKVGAIAYNLELPQELGRVHNTFHVSNLKKCYAEEPLAVPLDGLHIDDKLYFVEEPVEIMDQEVKRLKKSRILIVKV